MKLGFIGCGNMARAIINGVIKNKIINPENIYATAKNEEKLNAFCTESGICAAESNAALTQVCDVIIFSVKPQVLPNILPETADNSALFEKTVISIAAGKTLGYISSFLGNKAHILRVMPNLNAAICASMSAYCANDNCTEADCIITEKIFGSVGEIIKIPEEKFSIFSAVACCSPAFTFMYINALAKTGTEFGLKYSESLKCAAQSVIGSAQMLSLSADSPETLVKKVCSPGGTTIEGVNSLLNDGFENALRNAVKASYDKDKIL